MIAQISRKTVLTLASLLLVGLMGCQPQKALETTQAEKDFQGIVNGKETNAYPAIVMLELRSAMGSGLCSGSVVGLNPPTIVTARHCIEGVHYNNVAPKHILHPTAIDHMQKPEWGVAGDIAVLVFDASTRDKQFRGITEKDLFLINTQPLRWGQDVAICGYGLDGIQLGTGQAGIKRCGKTRAITANAPYAFPNIMEDIVKKYGQTVTWSQISKLEKTQFIHFQTQKDTSTYAKDSKLCNASLPDSAFSSPNSDGFDETH